MYAFVFVLMNSYLYSFQPVYNSLNLLKHTTAANFLKFMRSNNGNCSSVANAKLNSISLYSVLLLKVILKLALNANMELFCDNIRATIQPQKQIKVL